MFTPEPLAHGFPKVFVAAVGEAMTEMCGEVADGLLAHAFTTKRYFEEVTTPALLRGMDAVRPQAQRLPGVLPAVRGDGQRRCRARPPTRSARASRSRSTGRRPPTARFSNCTAGETCRPNCTGCRCRATGTSMGSLIDDEVLDAFAVVAPLDELADAVRHALRRCDRSRHGGLSVVRRRGHRKRRSEGIADGE